MAKTEQSDWATPDRLHLLFTACMLHDCSTADIHNGPQRFEVEAADVAAELLRSHKVVENDVHDVWVAMALHTSPGIAERIGPLARLVRLAVLMDFKSPAVVGIAKPDEVLVYERNFPRLGIEKVLSDAVVKQALQKPEKAPPASWPGILLRSKLENPEWEGVNKAF